MPDINDPGGCNAGLIQAAITERSSENAKLQALDIITEETFKRMSEEASADAKFAVYGIPVGLKGDWSKFEQWRTDYFKQKTYNSDSSKAFESIRTYVSDTAYEAWVQCKRFHAPSEYGVKCWVTEEDAENVGVMIRWNPMPPIPPGGEGEIKSQLRGGKVVGGSGIPKGQAFPPGTRILAGASLPVAFERQAGKSFVLRVSVFDVGDIVRRPPPLPSGEGFVGTWSGAARYHPAELEKFDAGNRVLVINGAPDRDLGYVEVVQSGTYGNGDPIPEEPLTYQFEPKQKRLVWNRGSERREIVRVNDTTLEHKQWSNHTRNVLYTSATLKKQ